MTVKRRTIWIDDESWDMIGRLAAEAIMTPSQYLKASVHKRVMGEREPRPAPDKAAAIERLHTQADRWEPAFGHSRPAPKPGRK